MINEIINNVFGYIIAIFNFLLPALHIPDNFISAIDATFAFMIGIYQGASYFVPLDIFVVCYSTILIVDNFSLVVRIVKWIISLIPGVG